MYVQRWPCNCEKSNICLFSSSAIYEQFWEPKILIDMISTDYNIEEFQKFFLKTPVNFLGTQMIDYNRHILVDRLYIEFFLRINFWKNQRDFLAKGLNGPLYKTEEYFLKMGKLCFFLLTFVYISWPASLILSFL